MGLIGNVDTLYFTIDINNYEYVMVNVLEDLQLLIEKKFFKRGFKDDVYTFGGIVFDVVNGRYSWSYGLKCDDFSIWFARMGNDSVYPIYVEFSQEYLWKYGYRKAYELFMTWIKRDCGLLVNTTKVSRGDLAVHTDLPILKKEYLNFLHYDPRCELTKTKEVDDKKLLEVFENLRSGYTGIRIGKGQPLMARIYNKSLEIRKSKKAWFNAIWEEKGLNTKEVINIEFEIKRDFFKSRSIETVEDFFDNLGEIWVYLTENYLCFRQKDNKRRSRRTICAWWQDIRINSFTYDGSLNARRQGNEISKEAALTAIKGYLTSYMAANGMVDFSDKEIKAFLHDLSHQDIIDRFKGKMTIEQLVDKKRKSSLSRKKYNPDSIFIGEEEQYEDKYQKQRQGIGYGSDGFR